MDAARHVRDTTSESGSPGQGLGYKAGPRQGAEVSGDIDPLGGRWSREQKGPAGVGPPQHWLTDTVPWRPVCLSWQEVCRPMAGAGEADGS